MGTSQSTPTNETIDESIQNALDEFFYCPPLNAPTGQTQTPNMQDLSNYPPLSMPTDQTLSGVDQGFVHDNFYHPHLSAPTDQTPNQPVQSYPTLSTPTNQTVQGDSDDLLNPPLVQMSNRNRTCCSCYRLEPIAVDSGYTSFVDGRDICLDCLSIVITTAKAFEPVISRVHYFFKKYMKLPMKKDIPIYLVDQNELRRTGTSIGDDAIIFGKCFSKADTINVVEKCVWRGYDLEAVTKTKTVKGDKVSAILVLYGLPKQVLGATLAHEMVHAWIALKGWKSIMEKKVEEAICEAVAYRWLKYIADVHDASYSQENVEFAAELTEILKSLIKNGTFNLSGAKFLEAKRAIKKYGLEYTVKNTVRKGSLPK